MFQEILNEIKLRNPNLVILPSSDSRYELILNVPYEGIELELRSDFHCQFAFNFKNFPFFNYKAIENYFQNKLVHPSATFYVNSHRIYVQVHSNDLKDVFNYVLTQISEMIERILTTLKTSP